MELQQQIIEFTAPVLISDAQLPDRPTVREVAAWLRKNPSAIYNWVRKGLIPCRKIGRIYIFDKAALLKWATPKE